MIEDLTNKVYTKLHNEFLELKENIIKLAPDEIIKHSYTITIKQELVDMFYGTDNYSKYQLMGLLEKENTLDFLYESYMNTERGINNLLEEQLEEVFDDLDDEYEEKMNEKIEADVNSHLIEDISNALIDFNNYDFCTYIKEKYKVSDLDNFDVFQILNTKGGAKYLYEYFAMLVDDHHLSYLNEISVINSQNFNNIGEKILPKLKELIKEEQNKPKIKDNKECEER